MKTDRELLELAAKVSGLNLERDLGRFVRVIGEHEDGLACVVEWNPLHDAGDALRLAAKLRISLSYVCTEMTGDIYAQPPIMKQIFEPVNGDIDAATRRAIVRAAAALAEQQP